MYPARAYRHNVQMREYSEEFLALAYLSIAYPVVKVYCPESESLAGVQHKFQSLICLFAVRMLRIICTRGHAFETTELV